MKDNFMEQEKLEKKAASTKKKKRFWLRFAIIFCCVVAILALLGFGVYHAVLEYYLGKINIVTREETLVFQTQRITEEEDPTEQASQTGTSDQGQEEPDYAGILNDNNLPLICNTKDVTNILLLATDNPIRGTAGRSDVMMLVSVNEKTGKIVLCSFLRDLYAKYPTTPSNPINGGYDKLNHAHAYGGPELTMAVLKETFNVEVNQYVKVDFMAFVDVVDAMGGVELYLTAAEARVINRNERYNAGLCGRENYRLKTLPVADGTYHINGIQALCHARNRTIGSDWDRTQRQRNLITAMVKKVSNLSLAELNDLLNTALPLVTTNIPKNTLKSFVGSLPSYFKYEIESTKIPQPGAYYSVEYNMVPDLEVNCNYLYEVIYGEKPSSHAE